MSKEAREPYSLAVLSRCWRDAVKAAGVRHIKLHAARHTCATRLHPEGVPVAVIAAWIGHTALGGQPPPSRVPNLSGQHV